MQSDFPRTVEEIAADFSMRRSGLLKALVDEVDDFYPQCDPAKDNLCLYGETVWAVFVRVETSCTSLHGAKK